MGMVGSNWNGRKILWQYISAPAPGCASLCPPKLSVGIPIHMLFTVANTVAIELLILLLPPFATGCTETLLLTSML